MAWAVHWLQSQDLWLAVAFFDGVTCGEHVLPEFFPVTRGFPQFAVDQLRRLDLLIVSAFQSITHIGFDGPVQLPAF